MKENLTFNHGLNLLSVLLVHSLIMLLLPQRISWAVKNVTQVFFAYLVRHNPRVVESRLAQAATGVIKLMKDLQYLACGHALQVIMQQMRLVQKQETKPVLCARLDISVKVEIDQKYSVNLDIIAP